MSNALRKLAISAFLLLHLAALAIWNLPKDAPLRARLTPWAAWYMLPTGLWQDWNMFAPDPSTQTLTVEALLRDRHGMIHTYEFPSLARLTPIEALPKFRHAKYASSLGLPEASAAREYAARTVVRRMGLPEDSFPIDVQLLYRVRPTPPPGEVEPDAQPYGTLSVIETYRFPNRAEADP